MPPEYCEFSVCFNEKCRPWLEKHHPDLLTNAPPMPEITEKIEKMTVSSKKNDESDDEDSDDDDAKPKLSAAAALRAKSSLNTNNAILIRKEQRSRNKYVTAVKGCEQFGLDLKKVAKSLSKKFASSASVVKMPDTTQEIQIQGDVSMELAEYLVAEFPSIEEKTVYFVDNKTNKKTKAF